MLGGLEEGNNSADENHRDTWWASQQSAEAQASRREATGQYVGQEESQCEVQYRTSEEQSQQG